VGKVAAAGVSGFGGVVVLEGVVGGGEDGVVGPAVGVPNL